MIWVQKRRKEAGQNEQMASSRPDRPRWLEARVEGEVAKSENIVVEMGCGVRRQVRHVTPEAWSKTSPPPTTTTPLHSPITTVIGRGHDISLPFSQLCQWVVRVTLTMIAQLEFFEGQLAELDTHIEKLFSHMEHPIKTIPGIGSITGPMIAAELGDPAPL